MHLLTPPIAAIGRHAIRWTYHLLGLLALLGRVAAGLARSLTGANPVGWRDIAREIDIMGVRALALVFMASVTTAISSVVLSLEQLSIFGGLSLASFFTIKIILREAAPIIVGIILTVKAGPHVVARVAEAGASTPGKGPDCARPDTSRPLMPAVLGIFIVGPALYLVSVAFSLLAGAISQSFGSVENFRIFFVSFLDHVLFADLLSGLFKSFAFGFTIVLICGYVGSGTAHDAESVGKSALNGIVASYIAILMLNVLFATGYGVTQLIPGL